MAVTGDRVVGGQFFGDADDMGMYGGLMNKGVDVGPFKAQSLTPRFGLGLVSLWPVVRRVA